MGSFTYSPIGVVHTCFKEKFGIPRQPGLVAAASGVIELLPPYNNREAVRGLETFSHLWVLFGFHALKAPRGKMTVRPPRLGGNERLGVFATRSGFRPNPIGLSVVPLERIETADQRVLLHFSGGDMLDGTPVLDIKPYIAYSDAVADARGGFAAEPPPKSMRVTFSREALSYCRKREMNGLENLMDLITQILQYDPRPAYRQTPASGKTYGFKLFDLNVKWRASDGKILVTEVSEV